MPDSMTEEIVTNNENLTQDTKFAQETIEDFRTCCVSREVSLLGRKEVLTGKAKFGIFGDGKEVPQTAMARAFRKGDWRSGYYRDQTLMFALGVSTVEDFFAQLYADSENDPFSKGRQMNSHPATEAVDADGNWVNHLDRYNISSDISSTAGQMARGLGLALASRKYRESDALKESTDFSDNGNEICFTTIGDASTSEGVFWETINAMGVLKVPLSVSVWDDGYGISVPAKYQTTKSNISEVLSGFQLNEKGEGIDIYCAKAWDYLGLRKLYDKAIDKTRHTHIPSLLHIRECTQPQGHSTSGSHERYKDAERLQWEREHDCIDMMEKWMHKSGISTPEETAVIRSEAKKYVRECRDRAWSRLSEPVKVERTKLDTIFAKIAAKSSQHAEIEALRKEMNGLRSPVFSELVQMARRVHYSVLGENIDLEGLNEWLNHVRVHVEASYHTDLYSNSDKAAVRIPAVPAVYSDNSKKLNGYQILNHFFDLSFQRYPTLFAFGEDVGYIGDVNQGFANMQTKYGEERVFDVGIREWTIMGQAIGMAMRGLRPIAEIQYLDYLIYGLQPLTDDLATLRWRSGGLQQAPAIIRTRGHRLEGIWHAGSPMGMMIHSLRGMYLCVPRNMVQAAGMYNTLLQSDDPAIVVECLNGYRLKETLPDNMGEFSVPLGVPEVLEAGTDVTLVTYGSCVRVAQEGVKLLAKKGISVELIDVQTLLPFDLEQHLVESLKKTNRIVFMDEDVPGGGTAYMMQEVLEKQGGYRYLDSAPRTLSAAEHRPPFGSDGDYFSKPNAENVFKIVYELMSEVEPLRFPSIE